jgi:hypothetical protein
MCYSLGELCIAEIDAFVAETTLLLKRVHLMNKYSDFFKTLHDEVTPTGYLGRGSHYSVLRSVVWHDNLQRPLPKAAYLDFAVVWDEDHDTRVIDAVELLYFARLLSPAIIVGERKGSFTLLISEQTLTEESEKWLSVYQQAVEQVTQSLDDPWSSDVAVIDSNRHSIINDDPSKVCQYIQTINMLWQLGIKQAE